MAQAELRRNSVLFWLVFLIGAGIIFIGMRFLVAPLYGAAAFGVPAEGSPTMAFLWAKGTRDIVSGLVLFVFLGMRVDRRVIAAFIFVASLIPIADFINVFLNMGSHAVTALMTHGGTAVFMIVLAAIIWRSVDR